MAFTDWERNQANDLKDHLGRDIVVGQLVVKPTMAGRSAVPEIRRVAQIKDGKVYLEPIPTWDNLPGKLTPLNYSGRIVIIAQPGIEFSPTA